MLTMVAGWLSTAKPRHCATISFSWLSIYFALNLALTIYNKLVLVGGFPFPYTLTAIHCLFGTAGSYVCLQRGVFVQAKLSSEETLLIFLFSWLYTVNIIVSNVSLHIVTVPFHQIIRSTTPIFVIVISAAFYSKAYTWQTYLSLIPVILGVALATAGDYYFTVLGFLLTVLGTILAAIKTVLTNTMQKSLSSTVHPLDLLLRMSPLAFVQSILYSTLLGEAKELVTFVRHLPAHERSKLVYKLAVNGAIAFALNYVSFTANRKTSPLTMTVAANLKQCLSIILGIWVFRLHIGCLNGLGIVIALLGGAWYAKVELAGQKRVKLEHSMGNGKEIV